MPAYEYSALKTRCFVLLSIQYYLQMITLYNADISIIVMFTLLICIHTRTVHINGSIFTLCPPLCTNLFMVVFLKFLSVFTDVLHTLRITREPRNLTWPPASSGRIERQETASPRPTNYLSGRSTDRTSNKALIIVSCNDPSFNS